MVGVLRVVRYASPRSLCSPRVALLPGVNFYHFFSSLLSLLALLPCAWCARACGGVVRGSFPPSVVWAFPYWSRCLFRARLLLSSLGRSFFCLFALCLVVSLASSRVVSSRLVSPLSLFSLFRPRAALPWNGLGPLGNQMLTNSIHVNIIH